MRALGFDVKKADVQKVLRDYDREETGKVTFDDFNDVSKCRFAAAFMCVASLWVFLIYVYICMCFLTIRDLSFIIHTGCKIYNALI